MSDGYVRSASQKLSQSIQFPPGYYIQWAGQFEYLQAALKKLKIVIPFTLLIIFVLLYINMRSVTKTFIVLLAVPFSLVGAFWLIYLLGYNMSVAVWIGIIALAGLDAETGVVMLLYLDHAWEKFRAEGRMNNLKDLHDAVIEGAVQRIRPKIMTVCAILFGLLPIMWSPATEAGADVMKPIATPMIGGVVTSAVLELLIYPVIFVIWRRRELPDRAEEEPAPLLPPALVASPKNRRRLFKWIALIVGLVAILYAGQFAWHRVRSTKVSRAPFLTQSVNDLTANFIAREGQLHTGDNEVSIEFRDAQHQLVDVGNAKFEINMNMPGMVIHSGGTIERTNTPGRYRAKIKVGMAGDWTAKISYEGPKGKGEQSFSLSAK